MTDFDLKKFLVENRLTSLSKPSKHVVQAIGAIEEVLLQYSAGKLSDTDGEYLENFLANVKEGQY